MEIETLIRIFAAIGLIVSMMFAAKFLVNLSDFVAVIIYKYFK